MIEYMVDLPELPALEKLAKKAPGVGHLEIKAALARSAVMVQNLARGQAPVRTGGLRNSILFEIKGYTAIIAPKKKYAEYVEGGTGLYGPHNSPIVPKEKKVLATKINPGWGTATKSGYYIIGRSSRGQQPNPFMERTYKLTKPIVKANFIVARNRIAKAMKV